MLPVKEKNDAGKLNRKNSIERKKNSKERKISEKKLVREGGENEREKSYMKNHD